MGETHTHTHTVTVDASQVCVCVWTVAHLRLQLRSHLSCSNTFWKPPAHLLEDTEVRAMSDLERHSEP